MVIACLPTLQTSISPVPLSGSVLNGSVSCFGASTATAAVVNLAGGSGNQAYNWANGSVTYTTAIAGNLNAGTWSLTLTDLLTACQLNQSFNILQAPSMSLTITSQHAHGVCGRKQCLDRIQFGWNPRIQLKLVWRTCKFGIYDNSCQ